MCVGGAQNIYIKGILKPLITILQLSYTGPQGIWRRTLSTDDHLMSAFSNSYGVHRTPSSDAQRATTILLHTHDIHIEVGEGQQPPDEASNACRSAVVQHSWYVTGGTTQLVRSRWYIFTYRPDRAALCGDLETMV